MITKPSLWKLCSRRAGADSTIGELLAELEGQDLCRYPECGPLPAFDQTCRGQAEGIRCREVTTEAQGRGSKPRHLETTRQPGVVALCAPRELRRVFACMRGGNLKRTVRVRVVFFFLCSFFFVFSSFRLFAGRICNGKEAIPCAPVRLVVAMMRSLALCVTLNGAALAGFD